MASPSTPPPPQSPFPPPKPHLDLDLTIIYAKHLKNVNWRTGDLKPYAVAYLDPDRRSATKPDDSAGSTSPVWNERLTLPIPSSSSPLFLTLDIFHSKPSETPKPLVATARLPLHDLLDLNLGPAAPPAVKTLQLRRPSGRPQGKLRIKIALRERPIPPPTAYSVPEQNYQINHPPPSPAPAPGYYYSLVPRDYRSFSPPPPQQQQPPYYSNPTHYPSADPYAGRYYTSGAGGYYSAPPAPAPALSRPYYERPGGYSGPSAPVERGARMGTEDYSASAYEMKERGGGRMGMGMGMGAGVGVEAVAGAMGGLALGEGGKYEEEKEAERVESEHRGAGASRGDDYSNYRGDF